MNSAEISDFFQFQYNNYSILVAVNKDKKHLHKNRVVIIKDKKTTQCAYMNDNPVYILGGYV